MGEGWRNWRKDTILYLQVRRHGTRKTDKTCLYGGKEGNNEGWTGGISCKVSPVKDNEEKRRAAARRERGRRRKVKEGRK